MKRGIAVTSLVAFFVFCACCPPAGAEERIESFRVSATIAEDASLTVTETLAVSVEHDQIRRGIIREFPTIIRDAANRPLRTGFELLEATLNGAEVPAEVTRTGSWVEVRLGDPDTLLTQETHTFQITYRTTGHVGFHEDHDELYWNVTGNAWVFPIDRAEFRLTLPGLEEGHGFRQTEWFTGSAGETGKDARLLPDNAVETTRPLLPGEGLTVVYAWPKGVLDPDMAIGPETFERWQVSPFRPVLAGLAVVLLVYYLGVWALAGHDPPARNVIPRFTPPEGVDPGFLRYATTMRFDDQAMAASLLGLCVKGVVTIEERRLTADAIPGLEEASPLAGQAMALMGRLFGSEHILHLNRDGLAVADLNPRERLVVSSLFGESRNELVLGGADRQVVQKAWKEIKRGFEADGRAYFNRNLPWWIGGLAAYGLVAVVLFGLTLWWQSLGVPFWFDALVAVAAPGFLLLPFVLPIDRKSGGMAATLLFKGLFPGMFIAVCLGFAWTGSGPDIAVDPLACLVPFFSMLLIAVFRSLLPARTRMGAELRDEANGLRMYMNTAEKERLAALSPAGQTPGHFEDLLPHACALGIQGTWAERFEQILAEASYTPSWHTGRRTPIYASGQMVSLVSGVSRSLGASRGGSGLKGGSSGGGGGGGGGRGW